jgi:signal transduction histidine kinase
VLSPLHGIQEVLASLNKAILYTVGIVFLLAVVTSLIVSRNLSRSIQSLRHATRLITQGEYAARSPVRRSDELGDLSQDFNSMAERLEEASKKINQYEGRRRQFLMDVTHELRTPLTSIRGITEGLKSGLVTLPEDKMKYYSIIEKETFRLIRLINELLDMEKIESGMIDLNHSVTGLKDLLEVITESLEVLVEEKKLQLTIECDPDIRIYGDYDRLVQILINLVKNSIQFTDYGSIRLTGSETKEATVIVVSDTGKGMTPQELSLIWERFYKSDASRTKNKSETGLGLSIVKKLVEAHQGVITVESIPGIGSTFTITLPKSDSQLAAALRNENMP